MRGELTNGVLTNLELYKEDDRYYLQATYHCTYPSDFEYDMFIGKICLPIKEKLDCEYIINEEDYDFFGKKQVLKLEENYMDIDLGFGKLYVDEDKNGVLFSTTNCYDVEEVTVEQIEERLGHKIKIIDGKQ